MNNTILRTIPRTGLKTASPFQKSSYISITASRTFATAVSRDILDLKDPRLGWSTAKPSPPSEQAANTRHVSADGFDYNSFCGAALAEKEKDGSYRVFNDINRLAYSFPFAKDNNGRRVTVWCANDYLGMSRNRQVLDAIHTTLERSGAGAGGTRNISGNNQQVQLLEAKVAELHSKAAGLVFSSCYVANDATLATLGSKLPGCVFLSDELNHASIIAGVQHSKAKKLIYKHNDLADLENKLQSLPKETPKIIVFESVYSMSGTVGKIKEICTLAKQYGALTFLDEVHAVGMYGQQGAGVAQHLDWHAQSGQRSVSDMVDIVSGTFGKAYGNVGGYIAGSAKLVDYVRSLAPGFIFTTSLPPAVLAGARTAIEIQQNDLTHRRLQQVHTRATRAELENLDFPVLRNPSHILPVLVGNAKDAKAASDILLKKWGIYVQAINYPTVPVGTERLRITPTPGHTKELREQLLTALDDVWCELGLKRKSDWLEMEGLGDEAREGLVSAEPSLWSDAQLGLDVVESSSVEGSRIQQAAMEIPPS